jgi:hypothetical protein
MVQALAAIVALFLSVYVPIRIRNLDRRAAAEERLQKANALAFFILPDIFEMYNEAIRGQAFLEVKHQRDSFRRADVLAQLTISSADRLQPVADRLWLFERDCGGAINRAITYSLYFNRKVAEYFSGDDIPLSKLTSFHSIYGTTLSDTKDTANKAVALLEKRYDLKTR